MSNTSKIPALTRVSEVINELQDAHYQMMNDQIPLQLAKLEDFICNAESVDKTDIASAGNSFVSASDA